MHHSLIDPAMPALTCSWRTSCVVVEIWSSLALAGCWMLFGTGVGMLVAL